MKKLIVTAVLAMAVAVSAIAQPKAIGLRGGYDGVEVSYQHLMSEKSFFEVDLGADIVGGFGAKGTFMFNYVFLSPQWTSKGEWNWYAGAGVSTGWVYDLSFKKVAQAGEYKINERNGMGFMAGVPVQVGLSYTFWFPLQISFDVRPTLGIHVGKAYGANNEHVENKCGFYASGLYGFVPTLSVHYCF